jgi:hypothetical protein
MQFGDKKRQMEELYLLIAGDCNGYGLGSEALVGGIGGFL